MAVLKEIPKYKLDILGVQVKWDRGGTEPASVERGVRNKFTALELRC